MNMKMKSELSEFACAFAFVVQRTDESKTTSMLPLYGHHIGYVS